MYVGAHSSVLELVVSGGKGYKAEGLGVKGFYQKACRSFGGERLPRRLVFFHWQSSLLLYRHECMYVGMYVHIY